MSRITPPNGSAVIALSFSYQGIAAIINTLPRLSSSRRDPRFVGGITKVNPIHPRISDLEGAAAWSRDAWISPTTSCHQMHLGGHNQRAALSHG
jgi:hypothetical protein